MNNGRQLTNELIYNLSTKDKAIKGRSIIITFRLDNTSNRDLRVLKWYTPLEGQQGKIFRVVCDGKELLYEGPMVKRGNPGKDDYVHIRSNNSVSSQVDLSETYTFPECNECLVEFKGKIYDVAESDESLPKQNGESKSITISGNSVTFKIVNE
jgi:hypothetical protein